MIWVILAFSFAKCIFPNTTVALTFVMCSINNLYSVPYEHIVTFRFERECIFGIVMIDFMYVYRF